MLRLPLVAEAPVYGWEFLVLLKHLLEQGLPKTAIAERLGVSRRVIYKWLASGQLDRDVSDPPPPRVRVTRPALLDPYKPLIETRLATYPELSAVRLFAECHAAGYPGSLTQLKVFVRRVRPRPDPEPVLRFETAPGHQAQVDFAEVRFPWGKRFAFMVVLGYSRLLWLRFYPRQTMQTVMAGLEAAFLAFGGVPIELLFDQMKAVIIADERPGGGKLLENAEFLRFAAHWRFRIRACRPYRAQTKGKVERPIRYLRQSFLYGREFLGDGDLAAQASQWLETVANPRIHGTTGEAPRERFLRDERAVLQPLAPHPYRSVVLNPERVPTHRTPLRAPVQVPHVVVERRSLRRYCDLAEWSGLPNEEQIGRELVEWRAHEIAILARPPASAARRSQDAGRLGSARWGLGRPRRRYAAGAGGARSAPRCPNRAPE
jgi:transposase